MNLVRRHRNNPYARAALTAIRVGRSLYNSYPNIRNNLQMAFGKRRVSYGNGRAYGGRRAKRQRPQRRRGSGNGNKSMGYSVKKRGTNAGTVALSRRGGNKVQKEGRKKTVFVSRNLRQKIKKVIASNEPKGYTQESYYENLNVPRDSQLVHDLSGRTVDGGHSMFSPTEVLDATSILWNIKVPSANKDVADAGNFNVKNLELTVKKQWVVYNFKNNSQISMKMRLIDWSPKQTNGDGEDPSDSWSNELALQAPVAPGEGYNLNSITVGQLHTSPQMFPSFRSQFSTQQKTITLEPGKTFTHVLTGPNMKKYRFDKFNQGSAYTNGQTFTKGTLLIVEADLVGTDVGGVSRIGNTTAVGGLPFGLLVETTHYKTLTMPEFAGFTTATPATPAVPLDQRKDAMFIKHWGVGEITSGTRISDEQPTDPEVVPL